jgi:MFS family permease
MHFIGGRTVSNIGVAPQHPMGTAIITERFEGKKLGRAIGLLFPSFAVEKRDHNRIFIYSISISLSPPQSINEYSYSLPTTTLSLLHKKRNAKVFVLKRI